MKQNLTWSEFPPLKINNFLQKHNKEKTLFSLSLGFSREK
jgi:hypothetical protein